MEGVAGVVTGDQLLVDHVRSIDRSRVTRAFGRVTAEELEAIDTGLALFLGLERDGAAGAQDAGREGEP
jgi:mRNA-degrading endonuclease toxin of MazEF toxin-antitoxin module